MAESEHPLLAAVRPLVHRVGGELIGPESLRDNDVALIWEGATVGAVRLADEAGTSGLAHLIEELTVELGAPLDTLDRLGRQRAVRLLEERGAFHYRRSAQTIADVLGVTRFTIYNYLNRLRDTAASTNC